MEIKRVGHRVEQTHSVSKTRAAESALPQNETLTNPDFFENSGRLGEVRALIDKLFQVPDRREDTVEQAKELLAQGAFDDRAAAAKAAEAILG